MISRAAISNTAVCRVLQLVRPLIATEAIMTRTASLSKHASNALKRTISIELPEFAIRALEHRVEMTNSSTHFARSGQAYDGAE